MTLTLHNLGLSAYTVTGIESPSAKGLTFVPILPQKRAAILQTALDGIIRGRKLTASYSRFPSPDTPVLSSRIAPEVPSTSGRNACYANCVSSFCPQRSKPWVYLFLWVGSTNGKLRVGRLAYGHHQLYRRLSKSFSFVENNIHYFLSELWKHASLFWETYSGLRLFRLAARDPSPK
jgi:hypothetical protein